MFGFIAHYDINGFWEEKLSTTQARIAFLEQIEAYPCWGQPTHTWSDVERAIQNRLRAAHPAGEPMMASAAPVQLGLF